MNPVLAELITSFRSAQDRAVKFIAGGFGGVLSVRLPVSNCDWLSCVSDSGLHAVESINHIPINAHGDGIFIEFPDLTIDFDSLHV